MRRIERRFFRACVLAVALAVGASGAAQRAPTTPPTGVLVPLYVDPADGGALFRRLLAAHRRHPDVAMTVILNPDSGPGVRRLAEYVTLIRRLRAAGITLLGYVYTSYGKRDWGAVAGDIDRWRALYGPLGFFFDEMAYTSGYEHYYGTLAAHARRAGALEVVGNPGVETLPAYAALVDRIVVHEGVGVPAPASFAAWQALYGRQRFAFIACAVKRLPVAELERSLPYAAGVFVTDAPAHPTFRTLPAYFEQLLAVLEQHAAR